MTVDFRKFAQRVKGILIAPRAEWPEIAAEPATVGGLYKGYILILAAIPALCSLIVSRNPSTAAAVGAATVSYVLSLAMVYLTALIIDGLAPSFGAQKGRVQALKTAAYAFTASWLAGIGALLPGITTLIALAGTVYAIYLLYLGLPETMKAPHARAGGYTASTVLAVIAIAVIIALVTGGIFGSALWMSGRGSIASSQDEKDSGFERVLGSIVGSADTEPLALERLQAFAPEELGGLRRTSLNAERSGALGIEVAEVNATYANNAGRKLSLEIVDTGSVSGFMAAADWADIEEERRDASGFEITTKENGRIVHQEWNAKRKRGEYAVVLGQRFVLAVKGEVDDMKDLESAVQSVDLAGLEALKDEGVRKN